ncbi:radical SAM protein [bacterium]|nr:radical SAM protein [bacterium]
MSFFNFSNIKKARFHSPFIRNVNYLKMAAHTLLESKVLHKTITYPKLINFLITMKCNLRCEVCHAHDALVKSDSQDLKLDQVISFVKQCSAFSPDWHFSGGEPFARKDLPEIINEIHHLKMKSSLVSNGLLITPKLLNQFKPKALSAIVFSVLGDEKGHDKEVLKQGAFHKLLENIKLFASYQKDCKIFLNLILTPSLIENISGLFDVLQDLPIAGIKFTHLNYLTSPEILQYEQYASEHHFVNHKAYSYRNDFSMDDYLKKLQAIDFSKSPFPYQFAPDLKPQEMKNWYNQDFQSPRKCHFIWYSTFLYPDGEIKSCQFLQEPMGNIKDLNITEIWNSNKYQGFRKSISNQMSSACARCCKL